MFVNCAQVEVTGSGEGMFEQPAVLCQGSRRAKHRTGTPGPTIKLPGYDPEDPGELLLAG
jgi:hypothetical protein